MAERKIPNSLDAEKAVLGSAFMSKVALQKICDELSEDSFYNDANAKIFGVLQELNNEQTPVDITIVTNKVIHTQETVNTTANNNYTAANTTISSVKKSPKVIQDFSFYKKKII